MKFWFPTSQAGGLADENVGAGRPGINAMDASVRCDRSFARRRDACQYRQSSGNPEGSKATEESRERREAIKEIIRERFDFGEMARRSLGPEWQRRTPEERKEFVNLFIDLLERAYISAIEDVESVRDLREKVDGNYAEVRTRVVDKKGVEFSVDYRLHNVNGRWRVYDVLVENVSLVNNYRDQFNRILTRYSYEELIRRMKSKQFEDAGRVAKKTGTE